MILWREAMRRMFGIRNGTSTVWHGIETFGGREPTEAFSAIRVYGLWVPFIQSIVGCDDGGGSCFVQSHGRVQAVHIFMGRFCGWKILI